MAMTALVVASAAYSAYSQKQAGDAQDAIARRNADLTEQQADQAKLQGDEQINATRRRTRQLIGQQKVAYATQGVDLSSGAPAEVAVDTQLQGLQDEKTIRTNTALQAWGFQTQASNERFAGKQYKRQGQMAATSTLLNGFGQGYRDYHSSPKVN